MQTQSDDRGAVRAVPGARARNTRDHASQGPVDRLSAAMAAALAAIMLMGVTLPSCGPIGGVWPPKDRKQPTQVQKHRGKQGTSLWGHALDRTVSGVPLQAFLADGLLASVPVGPGGAPRLPMGWWSVRRRGDDQRVTVRFRVARAERDESRNSMTGVDGNDDVILHVVEFVVDAVSGSAARSDAEPDSGADSGSESGGWRNVCGPGGRGILVPGTWTEGGGWSADGYTFSCTTGVIAKCVRSWGYKPWATRRAPGGERVSWQRLHQACTRAARADYCGDGRSHTRDGTAIAIADVYGFNQQQGGSSFTLEAGFGADGAAWMHRERWPTGSGRQLACRPPPGASSAGVVGDDGLLSVRSRPR